MLIADDDPSVVKALADRCNRMGFDVETASNGMQALLKANRYNPDIVLVDAYMPKAGAFSICSHLLAPDRKSPHVVLVTGSRDPKIVEYCAGLGAHYVHKGAEFWEKLEVALTEIFPGRAASIRQAGGQASAGDLCSHTRVLLVDDDTDVRDFLVSRLEKFGVATLYAANAVQALRLASRVEPTVIVADQFMPNGDAQYLLATLRTTRATQKIPVIVLSGGHVDAIARLALQREIGGFPGAARIVQKSADQRELFEALQEFCGFHPDRGRASRVQ
jgi:CheY-like chemotaxis protein